MLGGWAILGLGGWLVFMAKPTSAAALGPLILVYLAATCGLRLWGMVTAVVVAAGLLVVSALVIDGSIGGFVARLRIGAEFAAALDGGHTILSILRLDIFPLSWRELMALVTGIALIAATTFCIDKDLTSLRVFALGIVATCALCVLGVAFGIIVPPFGFGTYFILQIWSSPIGAIIGIAVGGRGTFRPPVKVILLAGLFSVFPHVLSFGTNNNYWANGTMAALFWVLAGLVLVVGSGVQWRSVMPGAIGAMGIVAVLMAGSAQQPYRQTQPLPLQKTVVAFGPGGHPLPISGNFAAYIEGLRKLAERGGFTTGTPVIEDLTGHYPGALFALDAQAIGQAWMIGGYRGSNSLGKAALVLVPCERVAAAWLLRDRCTRSPIGGALSRRGLEYEDVGSITSPTGNYPQVYQQWLSRPVGGMEERQRACEASR